MLVTFCEPHELPGAGWERSGWPGVPDQIISTVTLPTSVFQTLANGNADARVLQVQGKLTFYASPSGRLQGKGAALGRPFFRCEISVSLPEILRIVEIWFSELEDQRTNCGRDRSLVQALRVAADGASS